MRKLKFFLIAAVSVLLFLFIKEFSHSSSRGSVTTDFQIIARDLQIPWDIVFLPEGSMLVTERVGNLVLFSDKIKKIPMESASDAEEGGLLGMTLHPNFSNNRLLYIYNTVRKNGRTYNQVERYHFENGELNDKTIIIENIPGAKYHDGGRMAFGPDGYLYITTGDANEEMLAQNIDSLAGKILRLKDDGMIPEDNPFGNAVYSFGHRNPQGLTWDSSQRLWSTEHGPSGYVSGYDELNLIEKGQNYGWPIIKGEEKAAGMKTPVLQSGPNEVWAPASALYWDGSIFFGGLRGEALYEATIDKSLLQIKEHFKRKFGRIRTIVMGKDGYFYLTTSNRDGRGTPKDHDDKVIKIDPSIFRHK